MGFCSPHPQALLQGSPCRKDYGATRPIPAETFLCEESFTKSTPKTSWFLEFQRRGSSVTPFEPPCSQESYYNDEGTLLPEVAAAKLDILMLPEQIGGENFACEVPEGSNFSAEKFGEWALPILGRENFACEVPEGSNFSAEKFGEWALPILGTAHKKAGQRRKQRCGLPLIGVSKEDISSLARL